MKTTATKQQTDVKHELSDNELTNIAGGSSNNNSSSSGKAGSGQQAYLMITFSDILVSS